MNKTLKQLAEDAKNRKKDEEEKWLTRCELTLREALLQTTGMDKTLRIQFPGGPTYFQSHLTRLLEETGLKFDLYTCSSPNCPLADLYF